MLRSSLLAALIAGVVAVPAEALDVAPGAASDAAPAARAATPVNALPVPAAPVPVAPPRPLIALDAGHGGVHVGAVGPARVLEKDVTRAVISQLAASLRARGYRVILTRTGDETVELRERVRRANAAGADLFVSVHCNAVRGSRTQRRVRGVETYFLSAEATDEAARRLAEEENEEGGVPAEAAPADPLAAILLDLMVSAAHEDSSRLARRVQDALVRGTGWPDRGVRQAPFAVLNGARMPAVLVEVGFLSHPTEGRQLSDPKVQARIAAALSRGIDGFGDLVGRREAGRLAAAPAR